MRWFESWWERVPLLARIGLMIVSVVGMVLGGAADSFWE
jgi:hypothetical protein